MNDHLKTDFLCSKPSPITMSLKIGFSIKGGGEVWGTTFLLGSEGGNYSSFFFTKWNCFGRWEWELQKKIALGILIRTTLMNVLKILNKLASSTSDLQTIFIENLWIDGLRSYWISLWIKKKKKMYSTL